MKQLLAIIVFAVLIISCNNSGKDHTDRDSTSRKETKPAETRNIPQVQPTFANLDDKLSAHVKNLFDHYLHVKTALVNSDPGEAKNGANAILDVLKNFDKSLLPAEQKDTYDKYTGGIKVSATAISSSHDLEKQREQFSSLSNQAYGLAKSFGAGRTVYHEHCPMAFDNKGAMWLSESKEVKNPYFGEKMMDCGTIEEVIEK